MEFVNKHLYTRCSSKSCTFGIKKMRDHILTLKLTREEKQKIITIAEQNNLPPVTFTRFLIFQTLNNMEATDDEVE